MRIDSEVLKKYNRAGPRYTSYPPAPHFGREFGSDEFYDEIVRTNGESNPPLLSIYVHIPFCPSRCYFCGCNVTITRNRRRIDRYVRYLKAEIYAVARLLGSDRRVVQMHWGGGTPTYLSADQIRDLSSYIRTQFHFDDAEVSIEADPRGLGPEHLPAIREAGFNRISLGVQDLNPIVLESVNRAQSELETLSVIDQCREVGFQSINVDLIYGLPYQSMESYSHTIDTIIAASPDRLAVFNYAHVPWLKKHQRAIPDHALPTPRERLNMLTMIVDRLTDAGYEYIGMDHFARPEDELARALETNSLHRNFQGYTTHAEAETYAFGVSAISQLRNVYAQNVKDEKAYMKRIDNGELPVELGYRLHDDDHVRRHIIMQLLCNGRVSKRETEQRFGIDFDEYFKESLNGLNEFVNDGLVEIEDGVIRIRETGRLISRNIAMTFDAYLNAGDGDAARYSRTI
ncbi:MAG: oxygen-independent coproporphyrinogen III oxidase [bacterium]|nr:oxygen-independent coproporphyrinogen III oxidase [bacterium]